MRSNYEQTKLKLSPDKSCGCFSLATSPTGWEGLVAKLKQKHDILQGLIIEI